MRAQPPAKPERTDERCTRKRRDERRKPNPTTRDHRVKRKRGCEDGNEHDTLKARCHRQNRREHEYCLTTARRRFERPGCRPDGTDDGRVERDLAHHEPRVRKPGEREGESGGDKGPTRRHQRPAPEVHGHCCERHQKRLEHLEDCVAALEVADTQRQPHDERHDRAVEGRRATENCEVSGVVETAAEQAVDHLVGCDPRRRYTQPREGTRRGRNGDQAREDAPALAGD